MQPMGIIVEITQRRQEKGVCLPEVSAVKATGAIMIADGKIDKTGLRSGRWVPVKDFIFFKQQWR